jgi:hypothetical protein
LKRTLIAAASIQPVAVGRTAAFPPDGARIVTEYENETVHVTWISSSKQELSEGVRARLPREEPAAVPSRRRMNRARWNATGPGFLTKVAVQGQIKNWVQSAR